MGCEWQWERGYVCVNALCAANPESFFHLHVAKDSICTMSVMEREDVPIQNASTHHSSLHLGGLFSIGVCSCTILDSKTEHVLHRQVFDIRVR